MVEPIIEYHITHIKALQDELGQLDERLKDITKLSIAQGRQLENCRTQLIRSLVNSRQYIEGLRLKDVVRSGYSIDWMVKFQEEALQFTVNQIRNNKRNIRILKQIGNRR